MTICLFGNYILNYSRAEVFRKGLAQNGVKVLECHTRKQGLLKYWDLYQKHRRVRDRYDVLLVGMASYSVVWFAKLLTRKKIVFDAFVSLLVTETEDRKKISRNSFRARYLSVLEKVSCRLADKVLLDTNAHIDYFVKRYGLDRDKFVRIFVGSDDEVFRPLPAFPPQKPAGLLGDPYFSHPPPTRTPQAGRQAWGGVGREVASKFIVHWHGHIVPFHGLETVIEAARRLPDVKDMQFQIITRFGSKFEKFKKLAEGLENIRFHPETDYQGLAQYINRADVCLGVFGNNFKARLVIPNKIYEAVACGKPVITGRQEVLKELFTENKNIIMINPEDPADLAQKIRFAKEHPEEVRRISQAARELYEEKLTPKVLGSKLKDVLF